MYRKGAVSFPVLPVLVVILLIFITATVYLYQKDTQLQGRIVELENLQRATEGKLEESKKTAAQLEQKLQESNTQIDSLTSELEQEKSAHKQTADELEQIKADLKQQKSLRNDLESKLNQAENNSRQINEQLKIIQQQKVELEEKVRSVGGEVAGIELGTIVVNNEGIVTTGKSAKIKPKAVKEKINLVDSQSAQEQVLEGKIIVVNKEFNFAVINLGSKNNIKLGDEFSIIRDGNSIGSLKVEKVHESISAAGFDPELKELIKENDKIVKR